jgi:hypothetical protein
MTDNTIQSPVAIPVLSEQRIALAIMILRSMEGARYKIVLPDGRVFSKDLEEAEKRPQFDLEPEPVPEQKKARIHKLARGTMKPYYEQQVREMKVGDVVVLTAPPPIDSESLRGAAAALACRLYGNGSAQSYVNRLNGSVEILRQS